MRRREILTRPLLPSSDQWPLPLTKGPHHCGKVYVCVRVALTHVHTHTFSSNILAVSLVLYFRPPVSLSFSLCLCGITSLCRVSELHPLAALPVLQKQDYLAPLRGSWCIFGLVSLDTSPTERSVPSTLSFMPSLPHIYLMSLLISFYTLQVSSSITVTLALRPFRHSGPSFVFPHKASSTGSRLCDWKAGAPLLSLKYFPGFLLWPSCFLPHEL